MSKLPTLIKLNFRALLSALRLGNKKSARFGGIGALLFLVGLSLYISGVYSFTFGQMLVQAGILDFLIPVIAIIGFMMTILMTVSAASGFVFSNKDSDLMLSLPVSAFSIMLSKILALYLECLVICSMFVLPSGAAYIYYGGAWDAAFIIRLIAASVFLPFLATLFCVIFGWLLSWVSARTKHKSIVGTVFMFVFVGAIMVLSFKSGNLGMLLLESKEAFSELLSTWLLPFGLLQQGILHSWLYLLFFCLLCLLPFLLCVWLFSKGYKRILSGLAASEVRSDYKLDKLSANSVFSALFKKEAKRYFGTSIYFMNTGFGAVMIIGVSIYALVAKSSIYTYIEQFGGVALLLPILLLALCGILSMVDTTCVSISLEGKTLWIFKESPVPAEILFLSKIAVNLLVGCTAALVSISLITFGYGIPLASAAAIILTCFTFVIFISLYGLWINLLFPKMDADNDTIVVKQSLSALLGYFGGWIPCAIAVFAYVQLGNHISFPLFCLLCSAFLIIISAAIWQRLRGWGAKRLLEL